MDGDFEPTERKGPTSKKHGGSSKSQQGTKSTTNQSSQNRKSGHSDTPRTRGLFDDRASKKRKESTEYDDSDSESGDTVEEVDYNNSARMFELIWKGIEDLKETTKETTKRISKLEHRVCQLENENQELKKRLEWNETETKKNNLIFAGLEDSKRQPKDLVSEFIRDKLQLPNIDIDVAFRIGKPKDDRKRVIRNIYTHMGSWKTTYITRCGKILAID